MYQYGATVLSVHDGDTLHLAVDLGCDTFINMTVRLDGINAPELSTDAGKASRNWLVTMLPIGMKVFVATTKDRKEKYGRYLGRIYLTNGPMEAGSISASVNEMMVAQGFAVPYGGGAR